MHIVGWKTSDYVVFEYTSSVAKKNNISQVSCSKLTRQKLGKKARKKLSTNLFACSLLNFHHA